MHFPAWVVAQGLEQECANYYNTKYRCTQPTNPYYARYGGRGIEFRFKSFKEFITHLGPRPAGTSVDRIDNNGHYELGNVRWATPKEQANNRRLPALGKSGLRHIYPRSTGYAVIVKGTYVGFSTSFEVAQQKLKEFLNEQTNTLS